MDHVKKVSTWRVAFGQSDALSGEPKTKRQRGGVQSQIGNFNLMWVLLAFKRCQTKTTAIYPLRIGDQHTTTDSNCCTLLRRSFASGISNLCFEYPTHAQNHFGLCKNCGKCRRSCDICCKSRDKYWQTCGICCKNCDRRDRRLTDAWQTLQKLWQTWQTW